jgi:uncharacterized membrane protein YdbT with pleckstrin-like domain
VGIDKGHLHSSEELILDLHPHWIMLVKGIVAVVVATAVGGYLAAGVSADGALGDALMWLGIALIAGSLLYLGRALVEWASTNFAVTTDRCIYREGIFAKRGIEIPLERINTIFFEQGIVDRMVGAGTLVIESAGETGQQTFEDVRRPVEVQNTIYKAMEDNENRKFDRVRGPAAAPAQPSTADELAKLAGLLEQGHLTQAEYDAQKARLLGGPPSVA